jgi:hypothetical protein
MIRKVIFTIIISISIGCAFSSFAADPKWGEKLIVVTPGSVARLCPYPNCGTNQHITRIPKGTVLIIEGVMEVANTPIKVYWFEVTFQGKRGWISIFDTDKQN